MESKDELINKVVESIASQEREIIDEFCKTFIAYQSLQGVPIADVFKHYTLCSNPFSDTPRRYWFERKREFEQEL